LLSIAAVYITFFHMKMSISSDPKLNKHCVIYCSWRESVWMWFPVFCDCWCRMMDREGVCVCVCVEGGGCSPMMSAVCLFDRKVLYCSRWKVLISSEYFPQKQHTVSVSEVHVLIIQVTTHSI